MNGDGTKDNPYQVTTVAEFYEATRYDSESTLLECKKYIKLMNDIDFNDYDYWNLDTHQMMFEEFDGQGHTIKNIYFKDLRLFEIYGNSSNIGTTNFTKTIKNVIFEFIKFDTKGESILLYMMSNYHYCYLINCEFRGKIFNSYDGGSSGSTIPLINMGGKWKIINCTFNVDYYDNGYRNSGFLIYLSGSSNMPCYVENCEFNVNFYTCKNYLSTPTLFDSYQYPSYVSNISIFLNLICSYDITHDNSSATSSLFKNKLIIFGAGSNTTYMNVRNASIVIRNKGPKTFPRIDFGYNGLSSTIKALCIYDKDVIGETDTNAASYSLLQGLTTEQMKDPEYLNSIGFPII